MRIIILIVFVILLLNINTGCKSSSGGKTFCDTTCMRDTMKFINDNSPLKPYMFISPKDCNADMAIWSYKGMGINRKIELPAIRLNKDFVRCVINDTSNAWLLFNDCNTGRGFSLKVLFGKVGGTLNPYAINAIDPKFSVANGLAAYTDKGNVFVEEMSTGKTAMMTFGEQLEFDFNSIHQTLDSVNITPSRIWAKVKLKEGWKELQKEITLQ